MTEIFVKITLGTLLFVCGIQDVFKKRVFLWMIGLGGILVGICVPFCNATPLMERIAGVAVGASVLFISKATEGKIGMGDGFLLCVTGLGMGFWNNLELFGVALLFAAIFSIILLICRFADRKKSFPFIPFLFAGYLVVIAADIWVRG